MPQGLKKHQEKIFLACVVFCFFLLKKLISYMKICCKCILRLRKKISALRNQWREAMGLTWNLIACHISNEQRYCCTNRKGTTLCKRHSNASRSLILLRHVGSKAKVL